MKRIHRPTLESARVLSALELNNYRFSGKHTVLTPELLEKMAASAQRKKWHQPSEMITTPSGELLPVADYFACGRIEGDAVVAEQVLNMTAPAHIVGRHAVKRR